MKLLLLVFSFLCFSEAARDCSEGVCSNGDDSVKCSCSHNEVNCVRVGLRDADICLSDEFLDDKKASRKFVPEDVDLSGNDIDVLEGEFFIIEWKKVVRKIQLSDNVIDDIRPAAFNGFIKLQDLSLNHNRLEKIYHDMFEGLDNLLSLDLRENKLKELKEKPFRHLQSLTSLHLGGNPIKTISSDAFEGLLKLRTLDMDGMKLKTLAPGWCMSVPSLATLSLNMNNLESVPDLSHLAQLQVLVLNGNPIQEILEDDFKGLQSLQKLELSSLPKLYVIGKNAFEGLEILDDVTISNNPQLRLIDRQLFGKPQDAADVVLTTFDLSNNSLVTLDENMLDWERTTEIDIRHNPWECDCRLKWLKALPQVKDEEIVCEQPENLKGISLRQVRDEDLPCEWEMRYAMRATTTNFLFIIVAILISAALLAVFIYFVVSGRKPTFNIKYAYRNLAMNNNLDIGESDEVEIVNADSLKRMNDYEEDQPYPRPVAL